MKTQKIRHKNIIAFLAWSSLTLLFTVIYWATSETWAGLHYRKWVVGSAAACLAIAAFYFSMILIGSYILRQ